MIKLRSFNVALTIAVLITFGSAMAAESKIAGEETARRALEFMQEKKTGRKPQDKPAVEQPPATTQPEKTKEPAALKEETPGTETLQPEKANPTELAKPTAPKIVADELLNLIPSDCLFCLRVNNFDYTFGAIDQFLIGASPMPMGVSMLVRMQLTGVLGDAMLTGINTQGNFTLFGVAASEAAQAGGIEDLFIAALLPITDYEQFVSGNPNCSPPDASGISKITSTNMSGQSKTMLVTKVGNYALLSSADSYDRLVSTAKSMVGAKAEGLSGVLDADEVEQALKEPFWAYGNVQQASQIFGPMLSEKLEEMKTAMEGMPPTGQGPMADPAKIMNVYFGILETLMKETKSVSIIVRPRPQVINMAISVSAVPGTDMANMLVADAAAQQQENKLLAYLEDGAVMNAAARINPPFWDKLCAKAIDLFATIAAESLTAEEAAKWKTWAADYIGSLGDSTAFSFTVDDQKKSPFACKYVIAVKDEDTFNRVTDESAEMMKSASLTEFYKSFGMEISFTIKRGVASYKGVSIDSAMFTLKSTQPDSPQGKMINAMYGEGFDYRWAIVDGLWVCVIDSEPDSAIRKLIDEVKAGGPKQVPAEVKAAAALIPDAASADFVGTYNYLRLFKMIGAMSPVPIPQIDIPTKSNIAFAGNVGNGRITVEIALPKDHLTEMMTAFQMMQQQMMMQQQQQQNIWTCPMHPQIRVPQAGKCPLCGMDLIQAGPAPK